MAKKKIHTMVTAFRDGFQSVYGARVFTKDFLPAVKAAVDAGITHFEAGGGARFQSLYFYCNEDAFDMMDQFRATVGPDINLQTLARGINVVGLDSQSRDIIKLHAELFKKHGMTTIRNFDALNDVNNLNYSGRCIVNAGLKHEIAVTMMALPPGITGSHTPDFYEERLKNILKAEIPFDSICFKDASGTATPAVVHETIKRARKLLPSDTKIVFHSHDTADICISQYMAAIEGGADQVDTSMAPVSGGTCQSDIISLWHALRGTDYDLGIDPDKVLHAEEIFKEQMKDYFMPPEAKATEPMIPFSPMPGGALTANTQMMRDNGILNRYPEVIKNMKEVVLKGGFGTSVTPVSQFYFQQAFSNTMNGPWKKITEGYGKMVLGYFGKTPTTPDSAIIKLAQEQLGLEPTTKDPIDINDSDPTKGVDAAKKMLQDAGIKDLSDENIFIASTCKEKGIMFLKGEAKVGVRKNTSVKTSSGDEADGYTVSINNKKYSVILEGNQAYVNGKTYNFDIKEGVEVKGAAPTDSSHAATSDSVSIKAPMPGIVLKINVKVGDSVNKGDLILVLEAMKMETPLTSVASGTVTSITVSQGDQVTANQVLIVIN